MTGPNDPASAGAPPAGAAGPVPVSDAVRDRFRRQRTRDTAPELALRRELHRRGLRYRVDFQPVAGVRRRADIVFTRARVAVFVDGCFWHSCPVHRTRPRNNAGWWETKLSRTVDRDSDTDRRLADAGWTVVRVWEHEPPTAAADRVESTVQEAGGRAADR